MSKPNSNAPITNLEDFFGDGITLAQYERQDDRMMQDRQKEAGLMNVDLIDMGKFLADEPDQI